MPDVLSRLADQQYAWADHDALLLDDRYRTRHLPLLTDRFRAPLGPDPGPGEYWPPARSLVVPLPDPRPEPFLSALAASSLANLVWWRGLDLRADRVHATLVHASDQPRTLDAPIDLIVRGPWIGQFNTGRIYLPVEPADEAAALVVQQPLLAGYLQLTADVTGIAYTELRDLIATYQPLRLPVRVTHLRVLETMDDLALRSRILH
ncbi:hypothetical protein E1263_02750 [Kribbella antibiotica]|uniref:Uncharacterized protein n=1 Tax=Kribbella antibiotica TaxID=190195 RepID=A0A4R4ZU64_9ACTN|nr:hypothetical protein [Kribbella antibiotica]TDD62653.1 hypothetical protein E1263_02750 [Kribbella antibiotica]